jgi:hypothetical protein
MAIIFPTRFRSPLPNESSSLHIAIQLRPARSHILTGSAIYPTAGERIDRALSFAASRVMGIALSISREEQHAYHSGRFLAAANDFGRSGLQNERPEDVARDDPGRGQAIPLSRLGG